MHVIVCSSNPAVVGAVSRAFDQHGHRLTVCESGLEVLGAASVVAADLVILDLETPGLGGLLLISALEERAPGVPLVAVSTRPSPDARLLSQRGVAHAILSPAPAGAAHPLLAALAAGAGSGPSVRAEAR
ncbi:MAG TPA: response regulator [Candidatus Methylomirabilis sp.]|nr:response regulator [Candidatus Methylomirabilis sp.]